MRFTWYKLCKAYNTVFCTYQEFNLFLWLSQNAECISLCYHISFNHLFHCLLLLLTSFPPTLPTLASCNAPLGCFSYCLKQQWEKRGSWGGVMWSIHIKRLRTTDLGGWPCGHMVNVTHTGFTSSDPGRGHGTVSRKSPWRKKNLRYAW